MKKNYLLSGLFAMAMTGMALISCTDTDEPGFRLRFWFRFKG